MTDGVYVAVGYSEGYSASNVILIQGSGGSIVVDTSADPVAARAIRTVLGNRLIPPVRAIVYTHSHQDHTGRATIFAGNGHPEIQAHRPVACRCGYRPRGTRRGRSVRHAATSTG